MICNEQGRVGAQEPRYMCAVVARDEDAIFLLRHGIFIELDMGQKVFPLVDVTAVLYPLECRPRIPTTCCIVCICQTKIVVGWVTFGDSQYSNLV